MVWFAEPPAGPNAIAPCCCRPRVTVRPPASEVVVSQMFTASLAAAAGGAAMMVAAIAAAAAVTAMVLVQPRGRRRDKAGPSFHDRWHTARRAVDVTNETIARPQWC